MLVTKKQLLAIQRLYGLSPREIQIVALLFEGIDSNKEIAERLGVTVGTAKHYSHLLFCKLRVDSKLKVIVKLAEKAKEISE